MFSQFIDSIHSFHIVLKKSVKNIMKFIFISIVFATILLHHLSSAAPALKRDARSIESTTECVIIVGVKKVKEGISRHANTVKDTIHSGLGFLRGTVFKKKPEHPQHPQNPQHPQQPQHPEQPQKGKEDDEYKGLDYAIDVRMSPGDTETIQRQKRDASNEEVTIENDKQGKHSNVDEVIDAANNEDSSEKKDIQRSILAVPFNNKAFISGKYRNIIHFK